MRVYPSLVYQMCEWKCVVTNTTKLWGNEIQLRSTVMWLSRDLSGSWGMLMSSLHNWIVSPYYLSVIMTSTPPMCTPYSLLACSDRSTLYDQRVYHVTNLVIECPLFEIWNLIDATNMLVLVHESLALVTRCFPFLLVYLTHKIRYILMYVILPIWIFLWHLNVWLSLFNIMIKLSIGFPWN